MMLEKTKKMILLSLGWLSLVLGILGILLPILPTTPFALLAAYFFSKGSRHLHAWLLSRPHFGPLIQEWEQYGVIRPQAKIFSTITILMLFSYTLILVPVMVWIKIIVALTGVGVLIFLWTRPSERNDK